MPVGTKILVSIIVVVCVSISLVNLFTIFGVVSTPDLLTYAITIGIYMIPLIIIGATLNKVFMEVSRALKKLAESGRDVGKRVKFSIKFKPWETIMADTTTHNAFYFKMATASILSVSAGLLSFMLFSEGVTVGGLHTMVLSFAPLIAVSVLIHIFSKNIFSPHGWREFLEHTWIALLVITFSISLMISLRSHVLETYPRQFWEQFMGFPLSLHTIMFFIIMLLLGGILIRLGDYFRFESSLLKASGTTLVLLSIAFLVPFFDFLDWEYLLSLISQAFSISLVIYGIAVAALLYKDSGVKYVVTNARIIKLNKNRLEKSEYYLLVNLKRVYVVQDLLASKLGYGNIVIQFKTKKGRDKTKDYCILYGVSKPHLTESTINAISKAEKTKFILQRKEKKRRVLSKKKPVKKRKVTVKKKRNYYYRMVTPFIVTLLLLLAVSIPSVSSDEPTLPSRHIKEHYSITYDSVSVVNINGTIEIYAYTFEGERMEARELKEFANISYSTRDMVKDAILLEAQARVDDLLEGGYKIVEDTVGVDVDVSLAIDMDSLIDMSEPDSPILAYSWVNVTFLSTYYELDEFTDLEELVMGCLKVGGHLSQDLDIICRGGHELSLVFFAGEDLIFGNGGEYLDISEDNSENPEHMHISHLVEIYHLSSLDIQDTDAISTLLLDIHSIQRDDEGEYLDMNVNFSAEIRSMQVPDVLLQYIPEQLTLDYMNSDLLRLFNDKGMDHAIEHFIDTLEATLQDQVHRWGRDIKTEGITIYGLHAVYDPDSMDSNLPLEFDFHASMIYPLSEVLEDTYSLIPTRLSFSETIRFNMKNPTNIPMELTVLMPPEIELKRARWERIDNPVESDHTGRQFTVVDVEPHGSGDLELTMGTTVDLMELFPFIMLILALLFTWFILNVYRIKDRKA